MELRPKVQVRELTPDSAGDFFALFDEIYDTDPWLNFEDNPGWGGCYCTFYDDTRAEETRRSHPG